MSHKMNNTIWYIIIHWVIYTSILMLKLNDRVYKPFGETNKNDWPFVFIGFKREHKNWSMNKQSKQNNSNWSLEETHRFFVLF